jgi:hypothetical protein
MTNDRYSYPQFADFDTDEDDSVWDDTVFPEEEEQDDEDES